MTPASLQETAQIVKEMVEMAFRLMKEEAEDIWNDRKNECLSAILNGPITQFM